MGATLRFYICPLKSSLKHHHNKGFRRPSWTDFHLALCVRESHLAFGVGAEGSKPSCPDYGETAFLCNPLSFTDIIHVQIILGPIVHPLRSQILAESSDKCNGRAGDMFHIVKRYNNIIRLIGALAFVERLRTNFMQLAGTITNFNFWRIIYFLLFYLTQQSNTYIQPSVKALQL